MRRLLAPLLLAASLAAQQSASLRSANGAALTGFSDDAKAEKVWEMRATTLVPRASAPGTWDLSGLVLTTYRESKPALTVRTAGGEAVPDRRAAQGTLPVIFQSDGLRLEGRGWTWRSEREGDAFALLAEVRGTLRSGPKPEDKVEVTAGRVDAAPIPGGVRLSFTGGVTLVRPGERLSCEQVDCDLADGSVLTRWVARGRVLHVAGSRAFSADEITQDTKAGRIDLLGSVRVVDAEAEILATSVSRDTATGRLTCLDDRAVQVRLAPTPARAAATLSGQRLVSLPLVGGGFDILLEGAAAYAAAGAQLAADRLAVQADPLGRGPVVASGSVRGTLGTLSFNARQARLDRARQELSLDGDPRVEDRRGFQMAGAQILARLADGSLRVDEGPGIRAVLRGRTDTGILDVEAGRIDLVRENSRTKALMTGTVMLRIGEAQLSCRTLSLSGESVTKVDTQALPGQPVVSEPALVFGRAQLDGDVRLETKGVLAPATRAELYPAVGTEDPSLKDRPLFLTLLSGDAPAGVRPRLEVAAGEGINAFVADRQEILLAGEGARFWMRGAVALRAGSAEGACALLEGRASRDPKKGLLLETARGTGEVQLEVDGSRATGKFLEVDAKAGSLILRGEARVSDRTGRLGIPAEALTYDYATRNWRMESAKGEDGQIRRPRIFLPSTGFELPLPQ